MSEAKNKYWKSLAERDADAEFLRAAANEFPDELATPATQPPSEGFLAKLVTRIAAAGPSAVGHRLSAEKQPTADSREPIAASRRDFLKAAGFTAALATATGCTRAPVQKAIPMLVQPETIVPGRSLHYATTCAGCSAACGVLAKVRDGRPIKLEGNPQHALSRGGLCAVGQASLLSLYDSQRLQQPLKSGTPAMWDQVDYDIIAKLNAVRANGGAVRLLTGTVNSPTLRATIAEFLQTFRDARHVQYDAVSRSAILDAHERTHGLRALPTYHFERAEVIVSFDADFLGTWISPVQFTRDWRAGRDLDAKPVRYSHHTQFEPRMSITGGKADRRIAIAPNETGALLTGLAGRLAQHAGVKFAVAEAGSVKPEAFLDDLALRLWSARGRSLVVSGSNEVREQVLVNFINHLLGNYGQTVELERPSYQAQGSDRDFDTLLAELRAGKVQALIIHGANPAYDLPGDLAAAIKSVPLVVSTAQRLDETAALAHYVCPDSDPLETWGDAEPVGGSISVTQPVIRPLMQTRQALESLAAWSGRARPAYEIMRDYWRAELYPRAVAPASSPATLAHGFDDFWDHAVQTGFVELKPEPARSKSFNTAAVEPLPAVPAGELHLVTYPTVAMGDGRHAYNPWLHELPDPITKVTWDNVASLSPATAARLGIAEGDVVRIQVGTVATELPAYVQPGQHDSVIAVALGYGGTLSARFADIGPRWISATRSVGVNGRVGINIGHLLAGASPGLRYTRAAKIENTGRHIELASTQHHHTLTVPKELAPPGSGPREIVQDTTLAAFLQDPHSGVTDTEEAEDLWPADHPYNGLRWGMTIDLNACTGCSACVIACQAENNVPVVGRDEIRRNREMHWLRVDRYYTELPDGEVTLAHQLLMCQQCENAPCETVCPVLATVHSEDGLNSQVYNRCVGTRYCANNCPYKARRFNWFNYRRDDTLQNLALNPDVAVRSRGVMEKCTFCVQRLQEAKIEAKRQGTRVEDGAAQTACQQSCPARAIHFGDLNDPNSEVRRKMNHPRRYRLLSELNVRPSVGYLTVVRNRPEETEEEAHG